MGMVAFGVLGGLEFFVSGFGLLKYKHPNLCPGEFPLQQGIVKEEGFR